jgi:hypothetical protein
MFYQEHGGECCGIIHIHDFGHLTNSDGARSRGENRLTSIIDRSLNECYGYRWDEEDDWNKNKKIWNTLFEVVLTDLQLKSGWAEVLKKVGFRKTTRFYNSNSGNHCTIFHYQPHPRRGINAVDHSVLIR